MVTGAQAYFNPLTGTSDFGPYPANMTGRDLFRGPGAWNLDVGISKTTPITERIKLEFRGELFNVLNHSNLYVQTELGLNDVSSFPSLTAKRGVPPSAIVNTNFGAQERRNVQFTLKVIF
jgi:hypothetical protein